MRRLFFTANANLKKFMSFDVRQGLDLTPYTDANYSLINVVAFAQSAAVPKSRASPSGDKAVLSNGGAGAASKIYVLDDTSLPFSPATLSTPFNSAVLAVAISDVFFAVGGDSPFLYVFKSSDNSYISVDTTSLGRVSDLNFSPDGSVLAVVHATSPYLRCYNTSDWSYIDAPVATGGTRTAVGFTRSGNEIVTLGGGSPYITVHTASTLVRTYGDTSIQNSSFAGARVTPHPYDDNKVVNSIGAFTQYGNKRSFYEFNTITKAFIDILPLGFTCASFAYSKPDECYYALHDKSAFETGSSLSVFDARTYDRVGALKGAEVFDLQPMSEMLLIENNLHKISGTVRDISNSPVQRDIVVRSRSSGEMLAKVKSSPDTGNYSAVLPDSSLVDVQFHAKDGELLNDLFYARVIPELAI